MAESERAGDKRIERAGGRITRTVAGAGRMRVSNRMEIVARVGETLGKERAQNWVEERAWFVPGSPLSVPWHVELTFFFAISPVWARWAMFPLKVSDGTLVERNVKGTPGSW